MRIALLRPHKTASSSAHELISAHFENNEICPSPFASDFYNGEDISQYSYFWPHMTYPDYCSIFEAYPVDHVIITLRNPANRFISAYNFFRFRGENKPYNKLHTIDHRLIERRLDPYIFRNTPTLIRHFDNYLSRFILGHYNQYFHQRAEIFVEGTMDKSTIASALKTITHRKNVSFIDIAAGKSSSNFPKFLMNIDTEMPHKNPSRPPFINHNSLNPEQSELIAEMTELDQHLYDSIDWVDID